jgi:membrane-bound serine protease (ClpP class)
VALFEVSGMRKIDDRVARSFRLRLLLALGLALAVLAAFALQASAGTKGAVVVVVFDVPVDPGSSSLMASALATAKADGSPAMVIEMNTPGGLLSDMTDIVSIIEQANQSGIPTYTYVPPNALAASAGSYIAMASNKILMGPGSEIGPSTPIVVGGTPLEQNHTEGAMVSLMVSLADKWGRNSTAAQSMVYSDLAYSAADAYRLHLNDGTASTLQGALSQLGLTGGYTVVQEGIYEQFLSALSDPNVTGVLILLGALALVLDLLHPTFVLSVAGAIALVAGFVGAEVVGVSSLGLVVILTGAALMFLELKLGHGFAMISGALVGGAGVYLLFQGVGVSSSVADVTQVEAVVVAAIGVLCGLYVRWVIGPLRTKRRLTGSESLPGKVGVASTPLNPDGDVRVEGITWRARSVSGEVSAGERVRVKAVEELVLVVEKAGEGSEPAAKA